jgi:hypothetical protein
LLINALRDIFPGVAMAKHPVPNFDTPRTKADLAVGNDEDARVSLVAVTPVEIRLAVARMPRICEDIVSNSNQS